MEVEGFPTGAEREEWLARAAELRPELHRYCARLMGSVIDGEDVVQDTLERALVALGGLREIPPLRAWLFRIAHNRALDLIRRRTFVAAESDENPLVTQVEDIAGPMEVLMREQAISTAVSRFAQLPVSQRSVVILKDVLDEPLAQIAGLLDLTVDAVKAHLARARAHLREINATAGQLPEPRHASDNVARYVSLFNNRDWTGLRTLLADDVRLKQSMHPTRVGSKDVGTFFSIYATINHLRLVPAWLEGREVIAVFENRATATPRYLMWLDWREDRITFIRDYRYVCYVIADAQIQLIHMR